jgi:peptidoglycan L-alanyl-D-glutamate endopeptidase CwlK
MKFGARSLNTLKGIHPDLIKVMQEAIKDSPVDFTITDGIRTVKQQQALYAQGRTKPGPNVTNVDGVIQKSNHQPKSDGFGYAVDLYPYINGAIDFNDNGKNLPVIAAHIKATAKCLGINIGWGGDWKATKTKPKGWDKPHFELLK